MSASANAMTERSLPQTRRKWVRVALLILAGMALLLAIAAAWIWSNRYDLIERQAITYLDSLGIEADLDIRSADGMNADIRNVRLSYDGEPFLSVKRLQAAYQWRELLNGTVERLDFTGLTASITLDEQGNIVDGWRPPASGGGSSFPVRGIGLKSADLTLNSPYGSAKLTGSAEIKSPDEFSLDAEVRDAQLRYQEASVSVSGPLVVQRDKGPFRASSQGLSVTASHPSFDLKDTLISLSGVYDLTDQSVKGEAALSGGTFDTAADLSGAINQVKISGQSALNQTAALIDLNLKDLSLTDETRRQDLAQTLSLSDVLADVPIAQNFAPTLKKPLTDLLTRSDVEAELSLRMEEDRRELSLRTPMKIASASTTAVLSPLQGTPLYIFQRGLGQYEVNTELTLSKPLPIRFTPMQIRILSDDGITVGGISAASGVLQTSERWRARASDHRPAALAPLSVGFDYERSTPEDARLTLTGQAQYQGDIPGGYVEGLDTGGVLTTSLTPQETRVGFVSNRRLRMDRLETSSDWIVTDFSGRLAPTPQLYRRPLGQDARLEASLTETTLRATRPQSDRLDAASLALDIAQTRLSGRLASAQQDWTVNFETLLMKSDTFPVANTELTLPEGEMDLTLLANARTRFRMSSPSSVLKTDGYVVRDMALSASGTAEQYQIDYDKGRVRLISQTEGSVALPALPVTGSVLFEDGVFEGSATTYFPRALKTPIKADYRYADGQGLANVVIDQLTFTPGGLQPQDLAPTLRGKIAQVNGSIDARLQLTFGGGAPLSGTGRVDLDSLSLGTAPGPVTGLSGTVELTSLFPVVTAPDQELSIETFNPGYPLEDGRLIYTLVPEGVSISSAVFPLGEGSVSFDPFLWTYGAPENRVILRVSGVEVGEFLENTAEGRLKMSGLLEGTIPVVVRGIDVLVKKGRLEVKDGGVIQYQADDVADAIPNEYAGQAMKALRNFKYDSLFLEIDGPLDGDVTMGVAFTGSNPDVLYNVPFQFDVSVQGELFNIARSFNPNALQQRALSVLSGPDN